MTLNHSLIRGLANSILCLAYAYIHWKLFALIKDTFLVSSANDKKFCEELMTRIISVHTVRLTGTVRIVQLKPVRAIPIGYGRPEVIT
jgi:hypothetical protein